MIDETLIEFVNYFIWIFLIVKRHNSSCRINETFKMLINDDELTRDSDV